MKKLLFLLILAMLSFSGKNYVLAIEKSSSAAKSVAKELKSNFVTITDSANNNEWIISNAMLLNRFHYFWSQKQALNNNRPFQWRYQISITEHGKKSRWVYDPNGYAREITFNQTALIYQLNPIRSFNRFIRQDNN